MRDQYLELELSADEPQMELLYMTIDPLLLNRLLCHRELGCWTLQRLSVLFLK